MDGSVVVIPKMLALRSLNMVDATLVDFQLSNVELDRTCDKQLDGC